MYSTNHVAPNGSPPFSNITKGNRMYSSSSDEDDEQNTDSRTRTTTTTTNININYLHRHNKKNRIRQHTTRPIIRHGMPFDQIIHFENVALRNHQPIYPSITQLNQAITENNDSPDNDIFLDLESRNDDDSDDFVSVFRSLHGRSIVIAENKSFPMNTQDSTLSVPNKTTTTTSSRPFPLSHSITYHTRASAEAQLIKPRSRILRHLDHMRLPNTFSHTHQRNEHVHDKDTVFLQKTSFFRDDIRYCEQETRKISRSPPHSITTLAKKRLLTQQSTLFSLDSTNPFTFVNHSVDENHSYDQLSQQNTKKMKFPHQDLLSSTSQSLVRLSSPNDKQKHEEHQQKPPVTLSPIPSSSIRDACCVDLFHISDGISDSYTQFSSNSDDTSSTVGDNQNDQSYQLIMRNNPSLISGISNPAILQPDNIINASQQPTTTASAPSPAKSLHVPFITHALGAVNSSQSSHPIQPPLDSDFRLYLNTCCDILSTKPFASAQDPSCSAVTFISPKSSLNCDTMMQKVPPKRIDDAKVREIYAEVYAILNDVTPKQSPKQYSSKHDNSSSHIEIISNENDDDGETIPLNVSELEKGQLCDKFLNLIAFHNDCAGIDLNAMQNPSKTYQPKYIYNIAHSPRSEMIENKVLSKASAFISVEPAPYLYPNQINKNQTGTVLSSRFPHIFSFTPNTYDVEYDVNRDVDYNDNDSDNTDQRTIQLRRKQHLHIVGSGPYNQNFISIKSAMTQDQSQQRLLQLHRLNLHRQRQDKLKRQMAISSEDSGKNDDESGISDNEEVVCVSYHRHPYPRQRPTLAEKLQQEIDIDSDSEDDGSTLLHLNFASELTNGTQIRKMEKLIKILTTATPPPILHSQDMDINHTYLGENMILSPQPNLPRDHEIVSNLRPVNKFRISIQNKVIRNCSVVNDDNDSTYSDNGSSFFEDVYLAETKSPMQSTITIPIQDCISEEFRMVAPDNDHDIIETWSQHNNATNLNVCGPVVIDPITGRSSFQSPLKSARITPHTALAPSLQPPPFSHSPFSLLMQISSTSQSSDSHGLDTNPFTTTCGIFSSTPELKDTNHPLDNANSQHQQCDNNDSTEIDDDFFNQRVTELLTTSYISPSMTQFRPSTKSTQKTNIPEKITTNPFQEICQSPQKVRCLNIADLRVNSNDENVNMSNTIIRPNFNEGPITTHIAPYKEQNVSKNHVPQRIKTATMTYAPKEKFVQKRLGNQVQSDINLYSSRQSQWNNNIHQHRK